MITATTNQVDAIKDNIAKMKPGETRLLQKIAWAEYKQLTEEMNEWPGIRLTYDRGSLEIMSPLPIHERYKEFLLRLVDRLSTVLEFDVESLGSTTFDQEWSVKGVEPDTCFYIANASRIIGKKQIDLNIDPPPDIVVEVDISNPSIKKLSIYEEMGVPEVWLYNEKQLRIFLLTETGYIESTASQSFPFLTSDLLTQYLEQSKTEGQSAALRAFRQWLKSRLISEN